MSGYRTIRRTIGEYAIRVPIAIVTLGRKIEAISKARCHSDIGLLLLRSRILTEGWLRIEPDNIHRKTE